MKNIAEVLESVKTVGIGGHIRPDGDCVGSCMALYLYIRKYFPDIDVNVYLDHPKPIFGHIESIDEIKTEVEEERIFDLFITCDVSARDRLALADNLFEHAKKTVCIDHHVSNSGFADVNHIRGEVSSCCEVLYGILDPDKVDLAVATAVYTGMIHDTGVFQYSSTSPETMRIAGELMKTGIPFSRIIDESFYQKTYIQNQVMGRVLAESILLQNGTCIIGYLRKKDMDFYGVTGSDLDGIVSQMKQTKGIEVAIFLYEIDYMEYKVSLRSENIVDVSKVASYFGGGGHIRAAGVTMKGTFHDCVNNLSLHIDKQLRGEQG